MILWQLWHSPDSVWCCHAEGNSVEAGGSSSGAGASGAAGASGSSEAGMRLYLSQIKEWIVEFSCDMLYITIRTDVAWYRMSE